MRLELGKEVLWVDAGLGRPDARRGDPAPRKEANRGRRRGTGGNDATPEVPALERTGHGADPNGAAVLERLDHMCGDGVRRGRMRPPSGRLALLLGRFRELSKRLERRVGQRQPKACLLAT